MKVKINEKELTSSIVKNLNEFNDDAIDAYKDAIDNVSKESLKVLKDNAPVRKGKYKKSLRKKMTMDTLTEREITLYSSNKALPHLLERSHATRNGRRTKAIPHFEKAENYVNNNLENEIKKGIGKIK